MRALPLPARWALHTLERKPDALEKVTIGSSCASIDIINLSGLLKKLGERLSEHFATTPDTSASFPIAHCELHRVCRDAILRSETNHRFGQSNWAERHQIKKMVESTESK